MVSALFLDRKHAAEELLKKLRNVVINFDSSDLVVLAIPRGGIIIGDVIASGFDCSLDIVVSRKIGAEFNPELAIGAIMPDDSYFVNERIADVVPISQDYIYNQIKKEKTEIERRLVEFRGSKNYPDRIFDKVIVLVDDGIATGATIIAAAQWIRKKLKCKSLIIAVPVAPARDDTVTRLKEIADMVIISHLIDNFSAVGQFYDNFGQVSDRDVKAIMKRYGYDNQ
jgi:predicted phosphoribosyltransferase